MKPTHLFRALFVVTISLGFCFGQSIDLIDFGNSTSEQSHKFRDEGGSQIVPGEFNLSARQIQPPKETSWTGNSLYFTIKVDPKAVNYLTFKFWGEDTNPNVLSLYLDKKLFGYRHLGDYPCLHFGTDTPICRGKFYYITTVLPEQLTQGKSELEFEVRLTGRLSTYSSKFEQFQQNIDGASIPIYEAYTHLDPAYVPQSSQTEHREYSPGKRQTPGAEVLDKVKERINHELTSRLPENRYLTQQDAEFLAKGFVIPWTSVYKNPTVVSRIVKSIDDYCIKWFENPELAWKDPRQYNDEWFGVAPLCEAISLVNSPELQKRLDESISLADNSQISRRKTWADLIQTSLKWELQHRRWYTNQSMIIDWTIYRLNKGLTIVDKSRALPEEQSHRFLRESIGVEPWSGNLTENGPEFSRGKNFYQTTRKGLTKELGYVGMYGEVLDWGALLYLSTCKRNDQGQLIVRPDGFLDGDDAIRTHLTQIALARSAFRFPSCDQQGNFAMRLERSIGWRDNELIGCVIYGARNAKEGSSLLSPFCTRDNQSIGYFKQMLDDNQLFIAVEELLGDYSLRVSNALIDIPEFYDYLRSEIDKRKGAIENVKLPMCDGNPDFIFTDEQDCVVSLKNKNDILYVSLYWRALYAINRLAKVHYICPNYHQFAVVRTENIYLTNGNTWTRPDWTNFGFANGGGHIHYPERFHNALAGEVLPISPIPADDTAYQPNDESIFAGRSEFYQLRFGKYKIGLNASEKQSYDLISAPENNAQWINLQTRQKVVDRIISVAPQTTVILEDQELPNP